MALVMKRKLDMKIPDLVIQYQVKYHPLASASTRYGLFATSSKFIMRLNELDQTIALILTRYSLLASLTSVRT